jgi:hypothetical protein
MPSFIADETAKLYSGRAPASKTGAIKWEFVQTVESEVTVKGSHITRQHQRVDGKAASERLGVASTGFGAELRPLFDLECPTAIDFQGREQARGQPVLAFRFSSPAGGCFGDVGRPGELNNPPRSGRFLADASSGTLIQFEEEAAGFPEGFYMAQRNEVETWGVVKIGNASYRLPLAIDFVWRYPGGALSRKAIEYKNHRHFEASTKLRFQGEDVK